MNLLRRSLLVSLLLFTGACTNVGYYVQSVSGQLDIWRRERPIDALLADPETPPALRQKLAKVVEMREFAKSELALPGDKSYTHYADLGRPFVVWNVFATPEFSMKPMQWCFPFAGCVNYRGYFSREAAEAFAATLSTEGKDIYVGGVPAYSTLGWFADPVLNTFIHYPEYRVAQLIFHELAHREAYAPHDSVFNESFAVVVEQAGVERWLARHGTEAERSAYMRERRYREQYIELVRTYHGRLSALYKMDLPPEEMRRRKDDAISQMVDDYQRLKENWDGFNGYDAWFARRPNNAQIASVAIYTRLVPAFRSLLDEHGGNLREFYAAARKLADMPKEKRTAELEARGARGG